MIYFTSTFTPFELFRDLWRTLKHSAELGARISPDELHVHIGLIIFLSLLYVLRKSRRAPLLALTALCALQLLNEAIDLMMIIAADSTFNWKSATKDTLRSIFWPCILTLLLNYTHPDFGAEPKG